MYKFLLVASETNSIALQDKFAFRCNRWIFALFIENLSQLYIMEKLSEISSTPHFGQEIFKEILNICFEVHCSETLYSNLDYYYFSFML